MNQYKPGCRPWNPQPPAACPCMEDQCQCNSCRRAEPQSCRFLLPRILAGGREWLRRYAATLQVEGVPACAQPPFVLCSVGVAGEATWTQETDPQRRVMCLHVHIPLLCQVEDARGCMHCGRSWVEVSTSMRLPMHPSQCWRSEVLVVPCVRLVCAACPAQNACFDAQLEIQLESYLVRREPYGSAPMQQPCPPQLPLYPPPCME